MMQLLDRPVSAPEPRWLRSGSCDQCASGPVRGECCTHIVLPISPSAGSNPDTRAFFALHGIDVRFWGEMALAIIPARCSALQDNGDCGLYERPERPNVCSSGPLNAWAGKPLHAACSYVFEVVEE